MIGFDVYILLNSKGSCKHHKYAESRHWTEKKKVERSGWLPPGEEVRVALWEKIQPDLEAELMRVRPRAKESSWFLD